MSKWQLLKCFFGAHKDKHWTVDNDKVAARACVYCRRTQGFCRERGWIRLVDVTTNFGYGAIVEDPLSK